MGGNKSVISNMTFKMQESNRTCISISEFKRYVRRKQKEIAELTSKGGDVNAIKADSIVTKSLYKILDINLYGYGKDFVYDTQEIFFALKNHRYKDDFIYSAIMFLNK